MGYGIEIVTPGGPIRGWRTQAHGKARGRPVVLPQIFGANPHFRTMKFFTQVRS